MAGLVPAHPRRAVAKTFEVGGFRSAWMPGTSPGTTREGSERIEPDSPGARLGMTCCAPRRKELRRASGVDKDFRIF
jgi:hypothetical protein